MRPMQPMRCPHANDDEVHHCPYARKPRRFPLTRLRLERRIHLDVMPLFPADLEPVSHSSSCSWCWDSDRLIGHPSSVVSRCAIQAGGRNVPQLRQIGLGLTRLFNGMSISARPHRWLE